MKILITQQEGDNNFMVMLFSVLIWIVFELFMEKVFKLVILYHK